jgi:hypothetical protein
MSTSNNVDSSSFNNQQTIPTAKYTEVDQNGEVVYQSDSIPAEITAKYVQPRETIAQKNAAMTGEKTSDQYRTFGIPEKFDNPGNSNQFCNKILPISNILDHLDWWTGYSKKEPNPLYRTTAQDYGAEKPNIHTMPTVYRTQSSAFTEV